MLCCVLHHVVPCRTTDTRRSWDLCGLRITAETWYATHQLHDQALREWYMTLDEHVKALDRGGVVEQDGQESLRVLILAVFHAFVLVSLPRDNAKSKLPVI